MDKLVAEMMNLSLSGGFVNQRNQECQPIDLFEINLFASKCLKFCGKFQAPSGDHQASLSLLFNKDEIPFGVATNCERHISITINQVHCEVVQKDL